MVPGFSQSLICCILAGHMPWGGWGGGCHSTCMANKQNLDLCFPGSCDCEARGVNRKSGGQTENQQVAFGC